MLSHRLWDGCSGPAYLALGRVVGDVRDDSFRHHNFADMYHWQEALIDTMIDAGMNVAANGRTPIESSYQSGILGKIRWRPTS